MRATALAGGVIAAMMVFQPAPAEAQMFLRQWSGGVSGDPTVGGNWSGGQAPQKSDNGRSVDIRTYAILPPTFGAGQYNWSDITIGLPNRPLAIEDTVTFASGAVFGSNGMPPVAFNVYINSGQLNIASGASILSANSIINSGWGSLTVSAPSSVAAQPRDSGGTVYNSGTVEVVVTNRGSFTNNAGGLVGVSANDTSVFNYAGSVGADNVPNATIGWQNAVAGFSNYGTITSKGQLSGGTTIQRYAVQNSGYFVNGVTGTPTGQVLGVINNGVLNTNGFFTNQGIINGSSAVTGGTFSNGLFFTVRDLSGNVSGEGRVSGTLENITVNGGTFLNYGNVTGVVETGSGTTTNLATVNRAKVSGGTFNNDARVINDFPQQTAETLRGVIGASLDQTGGQVNNSGDLNGVTSVFGGLLDNKTGGTIASLNVIAANGKAGTVTNSGTITTASTGGAGSLTNKSGGTIGPVSNFGTFINELGGTVNGNISTSNSAANVVQSANFGTIIGNLTLNGGAFTQAGNLVGTATINAGTLIFGNGAAAGNFALNMRSGGPGIVNNDKIVFDSTARDTVISTVISGTGSVENRGGNGNGAVTLTADNTYTGKTIVNSGFLALNGTTASSGFEVAAGASIIFNRDTDTTFTGNVTGAGNFIKAGSGTMTLDTTLGNSGVVAASGGKLQFGGNVGANNGINQASVLEVSGTGEIALGSTNMKVGGLRGFVNGNGPSGTISGTGNIEINSAADTTNQLAVVLSGNGRSITKTGAGTQEFYGANTYTGDTTIKAGILKVGSTEALGTSTNAVMVEAGANLELGTLGNFVQPNGGSDFTFSRVITGAGGLIKTSSNTVTLTAVNTYTGNTQVKEGTLKLGGVGRIDVGSSIIVSAGARLDIGSTQFNTSSLGNIGGNLTGSGGSLILNLTGAETYTGKISDGLGIGEKFKLEVTGGALTLTGDNSFTGGLEISGHNTKVIIGSNNAAGGAGNTIITRGTIINYANGVNSPTAIQIASNTTQLEVNGTDSATQSGIISEDQAGRPLEKIGTGTLALTAANTYTGITTITAGALNIQNAAGLGANGGGAVASGTVVANGAALELQGGVTIGAEALTLNGTGVGGNGALRNVSGNNGYGGAITVASNASIVSASGALVLNGAIGLGSNTLTFAGAGNSTSWGIISGAGSIIKNDAGQLMLYGANTFSGGVTLNDGSLEVTTSSGFGTGALIVNGGSVKLGSGSDGAQWTVSSLSGTGGTIRNSGASAAKLIVDGNGTGTFAGVLQGGGSPFSVRFTGGGTTTLSGANTLTGGIEVAGLGTRVDFANAGTMGGAGNVITVSGTGNTLGLMGAANTNYNKAIVLTGTGAKIDTPNDAIISGVVSGTGGIEKTGAGQLQFLGGPGAPLVNTYSGPTTITAGTIQIDGNANLGNDGATNRIFLNGGTLWSRADITMARGVTVNAAGGTIKADDNTGALQKLVIGGGVQFTGAGLLQKSGRGELHVAGVGGGAGILELQEGSLFLNSSAALGDATLKVRGKGISTLSTTSTTPVTFANGVTLDTDLLVSNGANTSLTLSGVISGQGKLQKTNTGILNLTGANTFTGGFTLGSGTVGVGSNTALGTAAASVQTGGTLRALANVSLSNNIVMTQGAFGSNQFIVDTNGFNMTLSGVISTNVPANEQVQPGLTKNGAGNLTLSGVNTYRGATIVNAGKLIVNGSIANTSSVTIADGAVLGGNAAIPNLTVQNGARISPGNSIGTVNIAGNLTLNAGSTTVIEIQQNLSDRINAGGTAQIAGTLQLVALGGPYVFNAPYTIITAAGGRNGTFGTVNTDAAFGVGVTSTVLYGATTVQVVLNAAPLAQTATTLALTRPKNVFAVASGMDRAVANGADPSAFFNVYNQPTREALAAAVNTLSGEVHTGANAMGVKASDQFMRVMLDPFALGRDASLFASAGAGFGDAAFTSNRQAGETIRSGSGFEAFIAQAPLQARRFAVWGAAYGQTARGDADAITVGSSRLSASDGHLAIGADMGIAPGIIAGVAFSGGQGDAKLANGMGSAKADIYQAGLYAMGRFGALSFGATGSYGSLQVETNRSIPVLGLGAVKADYRAESWSGRLEAAYALTRLAGFGISPTAALQAQSVKTPSFVEINGGTGLAAGVISQGKTNNTVRSELGLKFDYVALVGGKDVNIYISAAWGHYYARDAKFAGSLVGLNGSAFTVEGVRPSRDVALIAAGVDMKIGPNMHLGARFDTEQGSSNRSYAGSTKLRMAF